MNLSQSWVGRLDRSYQQIKSSVLNRLTTKAPEITDHSETNPLIIILSMFAGIAEVIHLYIDSLSREQFIGTARRYSSVVKASRLIDYHIKARSYATVTELFQLMNGVNLITYTQDIIIPAGTIITPSSNSVVPFVLLSDVRIPAGQSSAIGQLAQYTPVANAIIGNTNGTANQTIPISSKYANQTMNLTIQGVNWKESNSFGLLGPTDQAYVILINEDGTASLQFGDGVNGAIPPTGQTIFGSYFDTEGVLGNVPPNAITNLANPLTMPGGVTLVLTNPDYASGGADFEDIESIRQKAPRSIRSNDRAVTIQDYVDVANMVPGVSLAQVNYTCGKFIDMYIVPMGKGTATLALLNQVRDYVECRKMITTKVSYNPAGYSRIYINATVTGKALVDVTTLQADVLAALDLYYGPNATTINGKVSINDIITKMNLVPSVDTFQINSVKIEPFARPVNNNQHLLSVVWNALAATTQEFKYRVVYASSNNTFNIFKSGILLTTLAAGGTYIDPGNGLSFTLPAGIYSSNDTWEFTVYPSYPEIFPASIIQIDDYSAPIVDVGPIITNVNRTIFGSINYIAAQPQSNCIPK